MDALILSLASALLCRPRTTILRGGVLACTLLLASAACSAGPPATAFVVCVPSDKNEADLVALAAISASAAANEGRPLVLFVLTADGRPTLSTAAQHFLSDCSPRRVYCVGEVSLGAVGRKAKAIRIRGESVHEQWWKLVEHSWETSSCAVLADTNDFCLALRAAAVAAVLRAPLVPGLNGRPLREWSERLTKLGVRKLYALRGAAGDIGPEEQPITPLSESTEARLLALAGEARPAPYIALCNPADRNSPASLVPKLSLLAPLLASYRRGVVVPIPHDPQRLLLEPTSLRIVNTAPRGAPDHAFGVIADKHLVFGSNKRFKAKVSGRGVSVDLDKSGRIGRGEFLMYGKVVRLGDFAFTLGRRHRKGSPRPEWLSYRVGELRIGRRPIQVVLSCSRFGGYFDHASLDLDGNGVFSSGGDVDVSVGHPVELDGETYDFVVHYEDGAPVEFRTPSSHTFVSALRSAYARTDGAPRFVALVGHWDVVPDTFSEVALEYKPQTPVGLSDVTFPGTSGYERLGKSEGQRSVAAGRITGPDLDAASLMVCKTIAYESGWLAARRRASIVQEGEAGFDVRSLRDVQRMLRRARIGTTRLQGKLSRNPIPATPLIFVGGHASPGSVSGTSLTTESMPTFRGAALLVIAGCDSAKLDPPLRMDAMSHFVSTESMAMRAVAHGVLGYIGETRHGSEFPNLYVFVKHLLRESVGEALVAGKNTNERGATPRNNATVNLIGDPALRLFGGRPRGVR